MTDRIRMKAMEEDGSRRGNQINVTQWLRIRVVDLLDLDSIVTQTQENT